MKALTMHGLTATLIEREEALTGVQDMLDLIANARYLHGSIGLVIHKESLGEQFFDLKTGYAGEILQKFSNYDMKIAIIGDFSNYKSKSLHDFIYECNNGTHVFFKNSVEEGLEAIVKTA